MKFIELTDQQKQEICNRYISGELLREIAPDFQVSDRTISDWMKRLNIVARRQSPTDNEIAEIKERYLAGESMYSLAQEFPYCITTIRNYLIKTQVQLRDKIDTIQRYRVNETYFDTIDSERKAYWLGFILADGYCKDSLVIQLSNIDSRHLEQFLNDIDSTHPIKTTKKRQARLNISNKRLCCSLRRFPVTPKSALNYPSIPKILNHHFIRGYMDGDGGFYSYPNIRAMFCITTNNPDFLSQIQQILVSECELTDRAPYPISNNSFELRWSDFEEVKRIFNYLYDNATIWLPRKKERIESSFV